MLRLRVKFYQLFGNEARIDGAAECDEDGLEFELAMTESPNGRKKGVLKRSVRFAHLEDAEFKSRFLRKNTLTFTARTLEAFDTLPGASGYRYEVIPSAHPREVRAFVSELRLAIAQATMDRFIEEVEGEA